MKNNFTTLKKARTGAENMQTLISGQLSYHHSWDLKDYEASDLDDKDEAQIMGCRDGYSVGVGVISKTLTNE